MRANVLLPPNRPRAPTQGTNVAADAGYWRGVLARARSEKIMIRLKRVYAPPGDADGERILVERLWPRGFTKAQAGVDLWLKELAPSPDLRRWFAHDPAKWKKFRQRYWTELKAHPEALDLLRQKSNAGVVTLVYAARDEAHNSAVALSEFLQSRSFRRAR